MKLVTWNINGLRSMKGPIKPFLDGLDADIICFQETKITKDQIESDLALVDGYSSYFSFSQTRQGYSGVATYCKTNTTPFLAQEGLFDFAEKSAGNGAIMHYGDLSSKFSQERLYEVDKEGRTIITQHEFYDSAKKRNEKLTVINVYCPRADPEKPERQVFKMDFYNMLETRANAILNSGRHVIICGDINTSHRRIDHCDPNDPELFYDNPCREWMDGILYNKGDYSALIHLNLNSIQTEFCEGFENIKNVLCEKDSSTDGTESNTEEFTQQNLKQDSENIDICNNNRAKFIDTFRYFFPHRKNAFTCWNTMKSCRETNYGTRIDYILANSEFHINYVKNCDILPEIYGSDHCPVKADINVTMIPASKCPPCCTKYMTEFGGRQQTLSSFFSQKAKSKFDDEQLCQSPVKTVVSSSLKTSTQKLSKSSVSNSKKRKHENSSNTVSKQTKLHFFTQNKSSKSKVNMEINTKKSANTLSLSQEKLEFMPKIDKSFTTKSSTEVSNFWKSVLKGPEPPPLCKGHNEPCFLRTVKKEGPNLGKQFYCCRRPDGHKTNPEARCSFFQWKT
uniref:DNA-(apurinic or apyrimidinic site) endonuclease 2-like n=1 Tax=Styela clava TaxID=7725 RepID=UPI00193AB9C1|nr:DNA-(apurinic or apyrimidinic site) endonuclease 2-like [Styela clava]